jgi:hypothetical protein
MNSHQATKLQGTSQDDINRFIREVLISQDSYKMKAKRLIQDISNFDHQALRIASSSVEFTLQSSDEDPMVKLLSMRLLKESMETNQQHIIDSLKETEILSILYSISLFDKSSSDDNRGKFFFGKDSDKTRQTISNSFFRLILESIKIWSKWYSDDSNFRNLYENLLKEGVKFPQTYLYYKNINENIKTPFVHPEYKAKKEAQRKNIEKEQMSFDKKLETKNETLEKDKDNTVIKDQYEEFLNNLASSREFFFNLISIENENDVDKETINMVYQNLVELNKKANNLIENLLTSQETVKMDLFLERILKEQDFINSIICDTESWLVKNQLSYQELRAKYVKTTKTADQSTPLLNKPLTPKNSDGNRMMISEFIEIKPDEMERNKDKEILKEKVFSSLQNYKSNHNEYIKKINADNLESIILINEVVRETLFLQPINPLQSVLALKLLKDSMDLKLEVFVKQFEMSNRDIVEYLKNCALFRKESTDVNRGKYLFGIQQGNEVEKLSLTFFVMNLECLLIWGRWFPLSYLNKNEKSIFAQAMEQIVKSLFVFPEKLNYFKSEKYNEILKDICFLSIQEAQEKAQTLASTLSNTMYDISEYNKKIMNNFLKNTIELISRGNNDLLLGNSESTSAENHSDFLKILKPRLFFLTRLQEALDEKGKLGERDKAIKMLCEEIKNSFTDSVNFDEGNQIFKDVVEEMDEQNSNNEKQSSVKSHNLFF